MLLLDYTNDLWRFDGTYWTWIGGSNITNSVGAVGSKGIPSSNNIPRARSSGAHAVDLQSNWWIFGGKSNQGKFSDLWKFDGQNWTWVSGNLTANSNSIGVKGVGTTDSVPGARYAAAAWINSEFHFYLFGGYNAQDMALNDLWIFNGSIWTWISGTGSASYGSLGIPDSQNLPGARVGMSSWISQDALWLFGGNGYGSSACIVVFIELMHRWLLERCLEV